MLCGVHFRHRYLYVLLFRLYVDAHAQCKLSCETGLKYLKFTHKHKLNQKKKLAINMMFYR